MDVFDFKPGQQVSEMLKEGEDYIVVKDGNGYDWKLVNLNNQKYCKREGIIEIEAMRKSNKQDNNKMFRCITDKKTGLIWGIPTGISKETKDLQFKAFWIENSMTFDLSIPQQATAWAVISNSPYIEGSPNQHGKSIYKVIDKERSAALEMDKRSMKNKASAIIETLKGDALIEMALNLGVNVDANRSIFMLTNEVYRMMEENPKQFLEIYNNPNREYVTIFNKAYAKGFITHDIVSNTFMYGGLPMGHNKESAVKYLVDNTSTAVAINAKCRQKDSESLVSMGIKEVKSSESEEAKLRKKIMELESKLAESKKDEPVEEFKTPFAVVTDEEEELESLRARAKELKIKGAHLATKETLVKKIAELEGAGA